MDSGAFFRLAIKIGVFLRVEWPQSLSFQVCIYVSEINYFASQLTLSLSMDRYKYLAVASRTENPVSDFES